MKPPTGAPGPFLFADRELRLSALDALARMHGLAGVTHSQGTLEPRLATLVALREGLRAGSLPPLSDWQWPDAPVAGPLRQLLEELALPSCCVGQGALADTVLLSVLVHLDLMVDYRDRGASAEASVEMALAAFRADWQIHRRHLDELAEVFGLLPDEQGDTQWDALLGLLQSSGWQDVVRIRRLLEHLPELARVIAALGRRSETEQQAAQELAPLPQTDEVAVPGWRSIDVRVPELPGETRGVCRSDRIARMLPAEAMLLGHPQLRLVWHARRAERTLLCYDADDLLREQHRVTQPMPLPRPGTRPLSRRVRGPILVCVDTSASMQGGAEAVAKAAVLEAMRSAHSQGRSCHVFAFGGPDELVEMELPVDVQGIADLAGFLSQGFRGGTDICGPLDAALTRLEQQHWRLADLLIASDGEFGATPQVVERLRTAQRDLGLRVQGVLVADRETIGFLEIADDILAVRDWRRFGNGAASDLPVHTHRLTALYFPGALRNRENPQASPGAAAAAILSGKAPP